MDNEVYKCWQIVYEKDINGNTYARSKEQEEEKKERSNNFQSYGEAEK